MKNLLNNLLPAFDSVSTTGLTSAASVLTSCIRRSLDRTNRTLIVAIIGTTALFSANYADATDWNLPEYMKKVVEARKDVTFGRKVEDLSSTEIIDVICDLPAKTNNDDKKIEIYRTMIAIEKKVTNNGFEFANKVKWAYRKIAEIQEKHGKVEEAIINYAITNKLVGLGSDFDSIDHLMDNPKARAALINYAKTKDKDILKPLAQSYADKIFKEYYFIILDKTYYEVQLKKGKTTNKNWSRVQDNINDRYDRLGQVVGMTKENIKKSVSSYLTKRKKSNYSILNKYPEEYKKQLSMLKYDKNKTRNLLITYIREYSKLSQPIPAK